MPNVDYEELEKVVINSIEKDCHICFDCKTQEACKYMQKIAEERILWLGISINGLIFLAAIGVSFFIAVDAGNNFISSFLKDIKYTVYVIIGFAVLIYAIYLRYQWKSSYNRCSRIILDAERCILSKKDSEKPKQPQEEVDEAGKAQ